LDSKFWHDVITCIKAAYPLIKVLRLVDSDEKPAIGFIYEATNQAKEKIQVNFGYVKKKGINYISC
jgi:stage V sporulation protein SpoVS